MEPAASDRSIATVYAELVEVTGTWPETPAEDCAPAAVDELRRQLRARFQRISMLRAELGELLVERLLANGTIRVPGNRDEQGVVRVAPVEDGTQANVLALVLDVEAP